MPWGPLNPATQGFLGLLRLKNTGRNPDALLEQVRPTIDMEKFYLLGGAQVVRRTLTMLPATYDYTSTFVAPDTDITSTFVGPLTVPDGEIWYVHELTAIVTTDTAVIAKVDNGRAGFVVPIDPSVGHRVLAPGAYSQTSGADALETYDGTATNWQITLAPLFNVWAPPGSIFGFAYANAYAVDGASAAVPLEGVISMRYTPVPL